MKTVIRRNGVDLVPTVIRRPLLTEISKDESKFVASIDEMTYTDLVESARELLRKRDLLGLKIAKMAIKACTIRHGGRSSGYYTLTDFANAIGMKYKTLSNWTICYRTVASKIEAHINNNSDWEKARKLTNTLIKERTIERKRTGNLGPKEKFVEGLDKPDIEILQMFKAMSHNTDQLEQCNYNIKRALGNIRRVETKSVHDDNFLFDISENINELIDIAERIQSRCIQLIGQRSGLKDLK